MIYCLDFMKKVRRTAKINKNKMLVHCSAGVGRTGLFIILDIMLSLLYRRKKLENNNIIGLISKLRQFRSHAVQTEDQFKFIIDLKKKIH